MITLSERSERNLKGIHPAMDAVVRRAAEIIDTPFLVVEGLRSRKRQKYLKSIGRSWTLNSRHLSGHAVDLVNFVEGNPIWTGYKPIHAAMMQAAKELDVDLNWGGDWKQGDTPHYELDWKRYPLQDVSWKQKAAGLTDEHFAAPVKTALKESKTIWGALLAFFGMLLQWFSEAIGFASQFAADALAQMAGLAPMTELASALGANLPAVGVGSAVFGLVLVISRRINAAKEGKIG